MEHMEPASRTRDTAWPFCGRSQHPLGRRAGTRPRSIRHGRQQSTPVGEEPGFLQQLETLQGAVGKLSRNLQSSRTLMATAPPTTPPISTPPLVTVPEKISPPIVSSSPVTVPTDEHSKPSTPVAVDGNQETPAKPGKMFPFHGSRETPVNFNHSVQHTSALWQHYLEKVDPLLKIIDIPTIQHLFISEISAEDVFEDTQSLKAAILFAAAVSMRRPFGTPCPISEALMKTYAREVEDLLAASRFLAQPTIESLQALTIYLACGSGYLDQTYFWSLTAILVRLAMALKLHRDPENQGFSFSDCEHRRRLWWHICTLDANTSEANDTDPIVYERQCSTRVPEWSTDPTGPAYLKEMFYSAVRSETTYYSRTILFSDQFTQDNGYPILPSEGKFCIVEALENTLQEKYFRHCDPNLPAHRMAVTLSKINIARMKLTVLPSQKSDIGSGLNNEAEQTLRACIEIMEGLRSLRADPSLSPWAWLWQTYADWDAAGTCLSVLTRTSNYSSETLSRVCSAIECFFDSWQDGVFEPSRQEQWTRLCCLRAQADISHPSTNSKVKKSRHAKAFTLALTPSQLSEIQSAPMMDGRRSITLPMEFPGFTDKKKRHRSSRRGGARSNLSLPISPMTDEINFDMKALDLQGNVIGG